MGYGNWVSKKDTSFEYRVWIDQPWYVNDIRTFDFLPLQNMEMVARPDNLLDAPTNWMQIAPVISLENEDVYKGTMTDQGAVESVIRTKKGSWLILILMLIFFILSMLPWPFIFIKILFLLLFILFIFIHKWFYKARFKKG